MKEKREVFSGTSFLEVHVLQKKKNEINNFISHVQINIMHISLFNCLCKKNRQNKVTRLIKKNTLIK